MTLPPRLLRPGYRADINIIDLEQLALRYARPQG
jgi:hypothetical protein